MTLRQKSLFLVFTWRQKKLKLKLLRFYLYQVKVILKIYLLACFQLGRPLCFENRTRLRARKYRFALCFRVLSNQYVERSAYASVFKFNRETKRFERAKVNSRCFHWFPAAMLESLIRAPTWRLHTKHYNFQWYLLPNNSS